MNFDGDDATILGMIVAWVVSALGVASRFGKNENRLQKCEEACEKLSSAVTLPQCVERMESIKATNTLQFQHGNEQFIDIKKMISESNNQHRESFDKLASMIASRRGNDKN